MDYNDKHYVSPGRYSSSGRFDVRFIKELVQRIEQGLPLVEALLIYQLKRETVKHWLKRYASPAYKKQRARVSMASKRTAVRAVSSGRMTVNEAMSAYNIGSSSTIKRWLSLYKEEKKQDIASSNLMEVSKKKSTATEGADKQHIKALQQQLADAHLKVAALNTLIDVAEEQLKINIRKKPGARQS